MCLALDKDFYKENFSYRYFDERSYDNVDYNR